MLIIIILKVTRLSQKSKFVQVITLKLKYKKDLYQIRALKDMCKFSRKLKLTKNKSNTKYKPLSLTDKIKLKHFKK